MPTDSERPAKLQAWSGAPCTAALSDFASGFDDAYLVLRPDQPNARRPTFTPPYPPNQVVPVMVPGALRVDYEEELFVATNSLPFWLVPQGTAKLLAQLNGWDPEETSGFVGTYQGELFKLGVAVGWDAIAKQDVIDSVGGRSRPARVRSSQ